MNLLKRIDIQGFKTIRSLTGFDLHALTVLIGANGVGKSNFIGFFKMLNYMITGRDLQLFVGRSGGASVLLHDGPQITPQIRAQLLFETDTGTNEYLFRLGHAAGDVFVFLEEAFRYSVPNQSSPRFSNLGAGHREALLNQKAEEGNQTARFIQRLLQGCVVYQFHNTSETSRIRQRWNSTDNFWLKEDGANLAPVLLRLREEEPRYYARIVETIRQIAPYFTDFELQASNGSLLLQWRERGTDLIFGAHQASDGTLRVMALVTLLLMPPAALPRLIILDEPELGLHPFAISVVAGLLQAISHTRQVILATQSMTLIDYFTPEDLVVLDRPGRETSFRRLDPESLRTWLDEYSLAELWEKNVLGGKPA
jgi:predicted ATPase